MKLSVLAHALSSDLATSFRSARLSNFQGIVLDPLAFPAITESSQTARREIVRLLEREGLSLAAIDIRLASAGFSPRGDLEREVDRVSRAIDIAKGLRSTRVLCDLGPLPPAPDEPAAPRTPIQPAALGKLILPDPPPVAAPPPPSVPRDVAFDTSLEVGLRAIAERADRAGCFVAFRSSLGSFASLTRALKQIDCSYFGVDLDVLSLLADTWSVDQIFSALGPMLQHVRVRDALRGAGGRVVPAEVGKGQADWREMVSLCRDADFDGYFTLDTIDLADRKGSALRGAAMLRGLN